MWYNSERSRKRTFLHEWKSVDHLTQSERFMYAIYLIIYVYIMCIKDAQMLPIYEATSLSADDIRWVLKFSG